MRHSQEIASHFLQEQDVLHMIFVTQGIADILEVLMPGGTHKLPVLPVQEKSVFRVETEPSETDMF